MQVNWLPQSFIYSLKGRESACLRVSSDGMTCELLIFHHKGDIGVQESSGAYRIIDRRKNIFKLAQGEFVVPEHVEGIFENGSHLIEQVFVYGNPTKTGTVAVVVPFQPALMQWCKQRHLCS